MDKKEREKLYTLLAQFYPHAKQLNPVTLTAWGAVLERYDYESVKAAALDYAAHNKYFPDLADLLAPVHDQQREQPPEDGGGEGKAWMKPYLAKYMKEATE